MSKAQEIITEENIKMAKRESMLLVKQWKSMYNDKKDVTSKNASIKQFIKN
jgi:hypothetical protein